MKKLHAIILLLLFIAPASYAVGLGGYDAGAINSQYMLDLKSFQRRKAEPAIFQENKQPAVFILKEVQFINNNSFSTQELTNLVQKWIGQTTTISDLTEIRKTITTFYQSNGFPSVLVTLNATESEKGIITATIDEGPKNSIQIEVEPIK